MAHQARNPSAQARRPFYISGKPVYGVGGKDGDKGGKGTEESTLFNQTKMDAIEHMREAYYEHNADHHGDNEVIKERVRGYKGASTLRFINGILR